MSGRSRREHKPTTKFLGYYTELTSEDQPKKQKARKSYLSPKLSTTPLTQKKTTPTVSQTKKTTFSTEKSTPINSQIKKKSFLSRGATPILSQSKKATPVSENTKTYDKRENKSSKTTYSTPVATESPEIRRSSRQHKPNPKLKEFFNTSQDDPKAQSFSSWEKGVEETKSKKQTKSVREVKKSSNKFVAAISPMIRQEGIQTPIRYSKHISVGLVDCFEGLTRDLAQTHPVTKTPEPIESVNRAPIAGLPSNMNIKYEGVSTSRETVYGSSSRAKRPRDEDETPDVKPPLKRRSLSSADVRSLTTTKKPAKTPPVLRKTVSQSPKTVLLNRQPKVPAQHVRVPIQRSSTSPVTSANGVSHVGSPHTRESSSRHIRPPQKIVQMPSTASPSPSPPTRKSFHHDKKQTDIKGTLKKFLIMGTKVANAISETLKNNEEALLTKSSAFERKCLSLVHALAKQGADLEEDDMEKVLKLLDEEQEERRLYRHTFLESLRVSHLTNMALYGQMLRLLKTL